MYRKFADLTGSPYRRFGKEWIPFCNKFIEFHNNLLRQLQIENEKGICSRIPRMNSTGSERIKMILLDYARDEDIVHNGSSNHTLFNQCISHYIELLLKEHPIRLENYLNSLGVDTERYIT